MGVQPKTWRAWDVNYASMLDHDCVTIDEWSPDPEPMPEVEHFDLPSLAVLMRLPDWWARANCLGMDPSLFHAEGGSQSAVARARVQAEECRKVCAGCEVRDQCLERALEIRALVGRDNDHGIWAGTTPPQRTRIVAARRREMAAA